jgi:hypothetical protein
MSVIKNWKVIGEKNAALEHCWALLAEASVALSPFDAFADKASSFVDAAARAANDPIMPTKHFRLNDFQRAREMNAKIEDALQRMGRSTCKDKSGLVGASGECLICTAEAGVACRGDAIAALKKPVG